MPQEREPGLALLSDIDWLIILAAGAFLLLGKGDPALLRTMGRWYGRALHLKQELLSEVTRAADLPTSLADRPVSLRNALLGLDTEPGARSHVPLAVAAAPTALATASAVAPVPAPGMTWVNSVGPEQWSVVTAHWAGRDRGGP